MTANKNAFGNLISAFGGAVRPDDYQNRIRQIQRSYEEQARGLYVTGTSTTSNTVITLNPQTYTIEANYAPSVNPTKRADKGAYRRSVREGEMRYSDHPTQWLDERVEEMRLVL